MKGASMTAASGFDAMVGDWEGDVMHLDPAGALQSRRTVEVRCRRDGDRLHIINRFTDEAGATRVAEVEGTFDPDGTLAIRSPTMRGVAWESRGCILADWSPHDDPAVRLWELAVFHDGGGRRTRTWHHTRGHLLEGITIFEERRLPALAD
jgi:hypothetical protein